jgi:hypothetical protein
MRILIAGSREKDRSHTSTGSLMQAFRDLGHEVITCGHVVNDPDNKYENNRDIKFNYRPHPEFYTYEEILSRVDGKIDLILQLDPGFYFSGDKPKDIPCVYYIVDVHRGAKIFKEMAKVGNFDYLFIAHKYFSPLFDEFKNVYWLPRAFDDTYIKEYPEVKIECDISFCGENGIADKIDTFDHYDEQLGLRYHNGAYPDVWTNEKYRSWDNHSMEYAERAEILMRLSKDFNVRIYEKAYGERYAQTICRGKIGINRSLWYDSALRNFEIMACNRLLITDMLPFQDELIYDNQHYLAYNHYYLPFLDNFDLEYGLIRELVIKSLDGNLGIDAMYMAREAKQFVYNFHTFKNRAQTILDTVEGKCKGYAKPN